jgi:hypothetical protein
LQARGATSDDGRRHEIGLKSLDILLRLIEEIVGEVKVAMRFAPHPRRSGP